MLNFQKIFILLIMFLPLLFFSGIQPEEPKKGYWAMEGTLITHLFEDKGDSLSGPEVYELQDEKGMSVWFARHIYKDVCMSGVCRMIRLWLFWDGAGNYLGMQIFDNEPLTKSDHTEFEPGDYEKLDNILRDTASVLKALKQEDLIIVPDSINPYQAYEVDGYTAATQPALSEVVVKDAVYSCYTLWHTVYGPVQDTIHKILDTKIDNEYLYRMLSDQKSAYVVWAIDKVAEYPEYHQALYPDILKYISSNDPVLAKHALDYFQPEYLKDTTIQMQLTEVMDSTEMSTKYEILWKFIENGHASEQAVLNLLEMFHNEELSVGAYNLILRLITPQHIHNNEKIEQLMTSFSNSENNYIRNLTTRLLDNHKTINSYN